MELAAAIEVGQHGQHAPVAVGRLERFIGDMAITAGWASIPYIEPSPFRVGIVGAGLAGVIFGVLFLFSEGLLLPLVAHVPLLESSKSHS